MKDYTYLKLQIRSIPLGKENELVLTGKYKLLISLIKR